LFAIKENNQEALSILLHAIPVEQHVKVIQGMGKRNEDNLLMSAIQEKNTGALSILLDLLSPEALSSFLLFKNTDPVAKNVLYEMSKQEIQEEFIEQYIENHFPVSSEKLPAEEQVPR